SDVSRRKLGIVGVNEFAFVNEVPVERPPQDLARASASASSLASDVDSAAIASALKRVQCRPPLVSNFIAAARAGASIEQLSQSLHRGEPTRAERLELAPFAAVFEVLRHRSDTLLAKRGKRPQVFLANLGPIGVHQARAGF